MLLSGKTMVVTGGNSGIGEAIVTAAAAEGANVVIDYVSDADETAQLIGKVEAAGGHAVGVQADVSKAADLHKMVQTAIDTYGRLDVLVNNAGMETRASILDTTEQDYDRVLGINLKSAFFGTQFAAKQFIAQGNGGIILNISSVHEEWPMPGNIAYCVSKGGCACSPAPPAWNWGSTTSGSSTSVRARCPPPSTPRPWTTLPNSRH